MEKLKIWLYGTPFSGKTKFATEFPNSFVINTDGNAKFFTKNVVVVKNLDEFVAQLTWFLKGEHKYDTLIIDVLDHVYDFVREYYLEKFDIDHETDLGFGKAWTVIKEGFWTIINKIAKSDKNVIIISHETEYIEKSKIGKEVTKYRPSINEKLHDRLCGIVQLVGRCYVDEVLLNGVPVRRYYVSFGSNANELSGVRVPMTNNKIENSYDKFALNLKEVK